MAKIRATLSADASFKGSDIQVSADIGGVGASGGLALTGQLDTISLRDILSAFPTLGAAFEEGLPNVIVTRPSVSVSENGLSFAEGKNQVSISTAANGRRGVSVHIEPFLPNLHLAALSFGWDGKTFEISEPQLDQLLTFESLWQRIKTVDAPTCAEIADDVAKELEPAAKFSVKPALAHQPGYVLTIHLQVNYTVSIKKQVIISVNAPVIAVCFKAAPKNFEEIFECLAAALVSPQALDHLLMPLLRNPANSAKFFAAIAATRVAKKALGQAFDCRGWKTQEPESDGDAGAEPPLDDLPLVLMPAEAEGFETVGAVAGLVMLANALPHGSGSSGRPSEKSGGGSGGGGQSGKTKGGGTPSGGQPGGATPQDSGGLVPKPLDTPVGVRLSLDTEGVRVNWIAVGGATGYDVELTSKSNRLESAPEAVICLVPQSHDEDAAAFPQARFPTAKPWSGDTLSVRVRAIGPVQGAWSDPVDFTLPCIEPDTPRVAQVGDYLVITWRPAQGRAPRDYEVRLGDPLGRPLTLPDLVQIDAGANRARLGDVNQSVLSSYIARGATVAVGVRAKDALLQSAWVTTAAILLKPFPNNLQFAMDLNSSIGATSVTVTNALVGATATFGTNAKRPSATWFRVVSRGIPVLRLRGLGVQRGTRQRAVIVDVVPLPTRRPEVPFLLENLFIAFSVGAGFPTSAAFVFQVTDASGETTAIPAILVMQQGPWRQYTVPRPSINVWATGPLRVAFQATTNMPDAVFIEVYGMALYSDGFADGTAPPIV